MRGRHRHVRHRRSRRARLGRDADLDRAGARVLVRVGQRLADDEVRGQLDLLGQLLHADVERHRHLASNRQRFERAAQAALGERDRVQPAREAPQLGLSLAQLVAGEAQDVGRLVATIELALGDLEQVGDGHQPLLRTVVQIAPHALALGIGGLDHACSRPPQRGCLMATLELGRRA
jgi:hypothetical protein